MFSKKSVVKFPYGLILSIPIIAFINPYSAFGDAYVFLLGFSLLIGLPWNIILAIIVSVIISIIAVILNYISLFKPMHEALIETLNNNTEIVFVWVPLVLIVIGAHINGILFFAPKSEISSEHNK